MIISASRRTDIPAFYHQWFINCIRAGFVLTQNPYNASQIKRVSLVPDEVEALVFWTRNAAHMLKYLAELDQLNYRYYFQYTITGYPKSLEQHLPDLTQSITTFCQLSDMIGADKVIWRYDPILLSNQVSISEHKRLFHQIASALQGKTKKVVISFADLYQKTTKNLNNVDQLVYQDILTNQHELADLCRYMVQVCQKYQLIIETCAEKIDLNGFGIGKSKCIDDVLLKNLFGLQLPSKKDPAQREDCGCIKSIDIGMYNSCQHGCVYCYATDNQNIAKRNFLKHNPTSPLLIGDVDQIDKYLLDKPIIQTSLF